MLPIPKQHLSKVTWHTPLSFEFFVKSNKLLLASTPHYKILTSLTRVNETVEFNSYL